MLGVLSLLSYRTPRNLVGQGGGLGIGVEGEGIEYVLELAEHSEGELEVDRELRQLIFDFLFH